MSDKTVIWREQTPGEFLQQLLNESPEGTTEIGLSDYIRPYAISEGVTFELAREWLYQALDSQELTLTDRYRLRFT